MGNLMRQLGEIENTHGGGGGGAAGLQHYRALGPQSLPYVSLRQDSKKESFLTTMFL